MIENKAHLRFEMCGRPRSIETNVVQLELINIEFEKHGPQCNHVFEGEAVEFRIHVRNKSAHDFADVVFRDPLRGLEYVPHSFRIDGRHVRPHVHRGELTYRFERLCAGADHTITFECTVGEHQHGGGPGGGRPPVWSPGPSQPGPGGPSRPPQGGGPRSVEIEIE